MIICITAKGPGLAGRFEAHFAKAPYFVFCDTDTMDTDAIRNGYVVSDSKIGQNVVKLLASHNVRAVITGTTGENARALLKSSNMALHTWQGRGTVRDAIRAVMPQALKSTRHRSGAGNDRKTADED